MYLFLEKYHSPTFVVTILFIEFLWRPSRYWGLVGTVLDSRIDVMMPFSNRQPFTSSLMFSTTLTSGCVSMNPSGTFNALTYWGYIIKCSPTPQEPLMIFTLLNGTPHTGLPGPGIPIGQFKLNWALLPPLSLRWSLFPHNSWVTRFDIITGSQTFIVSQDC